MFGFFNELKFLLRNKAKYFSEYKGEKYHFCSENCKSQFNTSPKDYVEENATSSCCQNQTQPSANKSCC